MMRGYLLLAPVLLFATPASAQFWGGPSGGGISGGMPAAAQPSSWTPRNRETEQVRRDLRRARESGQISRREERQLRRQSFYIDGLASRLGRNGLSDSEAAELAVRRQLLREDVAAKRRGN